MHKLKSRFWRTPLARVGMLFAALALALTLAPGQASATSILNPHPSCAGGLVGAHDLPGAVGTLFVYFSSANNGTNCLFLQKNVSRGTATPMYVDIGLCPTANPNNGPCTKQKSDPPGTGTANYKYYAGPLTITNTNNKCIDSLAQVGSTSKLFAPFHCG